MAQIRTACIGTGYFSKFHYDAWRRIENVELVASVSLNVDEARAENLPAFENCEEMFDAVAVDLVDIITPPSSHLELIGCCVDAGVNAIICQKPFCNSLAEAVKATKLCKDHGVLLVIHENFRFQPWYRVMKDMMENGSIGAPHQFTFRLRTGDGQGARAYLDRQPYFQKMEKFLIRETGVHWIDTFRFMFGQPKSVYADLRKLNPVIAGEDAGYFIMEFDGGKRAIFDGNRHLDHAAENCRTTLGEALLEGNKGAISLAGNGEVTFRCFGKQSKRVVLKAQNWNGFAGDCVHALQSHVASALLNGKPLENTADDYLSVLAIEEAIYESALSGRKMDISQPIAL